MSTFHKSLPITLTSFINKAGTIGLAVIPVLLVERQLSPEASAWIMGVMKTAGLLGILLGGYLCDRLGLRATLLLSFLIAGVAMAPIPFVHSAVGLAALAALAQLGTAFYYPSARLLVTQIVATEERREAIAWQRTANNLAQIICFSIGAFLGRLGTSLLLFFDAATSFLALGVGQKILPDTGTLSQRSSDEAVYRTESNNLGRFLLCALIIASFSFQYDLYMVAAAARCKLLFGESGLAVFSQVVIINTALCAAFSVWASRHLNRASVVIPLGLLLLTGSLVITFTGTPSRTGFYLGSFVLTLGELVFNSLAGFVLIVIAPHGKNQGSLYSAGVLVQHLGRIAGAALAFPLIVHSARPLSFLLVAGSLGLILCVFALPFLRSLSDPRAPATSAAR